MDTLALEFFPYPSVVRGSRRQGLLVNWPAKCETCKNRECETAQTSGTQLCRYGVNYHRISDDFLIAGVVIHDYQPATDAYKRMRRAVGKDSVGRQEFARVIERCDRTTEVLEAEMQARRNDVMAEYRKSKRYQQDIVELLKPDMQRAFANVHDYKQFVQQILQNLEVQLQSRVKVSDLPMSEMVDRASHEERAIYWAAVMMDERLDAALLVLDPSRIAANSQRRRFKLHGLVTKYLRIYQRRIEGKKLRVHEIGETHSDIEANPAALTIIPHALIDNATKYAPQGSDIHIKFGENSGYASFTVASYGPTIEDGEKDRIFDLFFRGAHAKGHAHEGTGFGLGAAQLIAESLGTKITVSQQKDANYRSCSLTEFKVRFQLAPEEPHRNKSKRKR